MELMIGSEPKPAGTRRELEGTIFNIQRFSVQDGPGIRSIVFLKGCPLSCSWCCNPESQGRVLEIIFAKRKCISCGTCVEVCPHVAISDREGTKVIDKARCDLCGKCVDSCYAGALEMVGERKSVAQVMKEVLKDSDIYRNSGGGLTLSGGEPMAQPDFAAAIFRECRANGINTAMETSGFAPLEKFRTMLPLVDTFLFDIKHIDASRHTEWTGRSNTQILENLEFLARSGARVVGRLPLIPGVNVDTATTDAIADLLVRIGVREANLLPYHRLGEGKYAQLGKAYPLEGRGALPDEVLDDIADRFEARGLEVTVYNHG